MTDFNYHVALSFAGEDRDYVEKVARYLRERGVKVFYDLFELVKLWGTDLYEKLDSIYRKEAYFTIIFISRHYEEKNWTNHERRSALARALEERREYILPARFDDTQIPGLPNTICYIDLRELSPRRFAAMVIDKLHMEGILELEEDSFELQERGEQRSVVDAIETSILSRPTANVRSDRGFTGTWVTFNYSEEALSDVDFLLRPSDLLSEIIRDLKSHNWYKQNHAIRRIFDEDVFEALLEADQNITFVLGRNIFQAACGGSREAVIFMRDLRRNLAQFPDDSYLHILNGMFYEMYFNRENEFRGVSIKTDFVDELFSLQTVDRFHASIAFISQSLDQFREYLIVIPQYSPALVRLDLKIMKGDPHLISEVVYNDKDLIVDIDTEEALYDRFWELYHGKFRLSNLRRYLSKGWCVPVEQLVLNSSIDLSIRHYLKFPEGKGLGYPAKLWKGQGC